VLYFLSRYFRVCLWQNNSYSVLQTVNELNRPVEALLQSRHETPSGLFCHLVVSGGLHFRSPRRRSIQTRLRPTRAIRANLLRRCRLCRIYHMTVMRATYRVGRKAYSGKSSDRYAQQTSNVYASRRRLNAAATARSNSTGATWGALQLLTSRYAE